VIQVAGAGLPNVGGIVFVIACAGVLGWLLMLGVTLGLGAAAKRGDELELGAQRYLPDDKGAKIIAFRARKAGQDDPPAFCGRTNHH
jgi:hypothetical protein